MHQLTFSENQTFGWDEIQSPKELKGLNNYEANTLQFCRDWLNKKAEFTIQTSGSTGTPKTILLDAEKMKLSAEMTINALGLCKNDNAFICLNTEYIAGKMMLVRSMVAQMNMFVIAPKSNPLADIPNSSDFDFVAFVPLQLETIINDTPDKFSILNRMKAILIGGATISSRQEELFQQIKAPIYHTFGMTETLSHIALRRINGENKEDVYRILNHIQITQDSRGCLIIDSPFSEESIITNDVIELIDSKSFRWLGRADNIINSGGIKLYPEKIEKKIEELFNRLTIHNRFFIFGISDETLGQKVVLLIEGPTQIVEQLHTQLSSVLSKYEKPKEIIFISQFEETATGKIARGKTVDNLK